jgi:hypothetical protein
MKTIEIGTTDIFESEFFPVTDGSRQFLKFVIEKEVDYYGGEKSLRLYENNHLCLTLADEFQSYQMYARFRNIESKDIDKMIVELNKVKEILVKDEAAITEAQKMV